MNTGPRKVCAESEWDYGGERKAVGEENALGTGRTGWLVGKPTEICLEKACFLLGVGDLGQGGGIGLGNPHPSHWFGFPGAHPGRISHLTTCISSMDVHS